MYGYIYKIILPDQRYYIGQKKSPVIVDNYFGSGLLINRWFQKHLNYKSSKCPKDIAFENGVIREILEEIEEPEYYDGQFWLNFWEQHYIFEHKINDKYNECLNITMGGNNPEPWKLSEYAKNRTETHKEKLKEKRKNFKQSEESKKLISESSKGRHWYNNGKIQVRAYECPVNFIPGQLKNKNRKPHSPETKKKISITKIGEKNPMYKKEPWNKGIKLSEEHKNKLSETRKGKVPWNKGLTKDTNPKCSEIAKKAWETKRNKK